MTKLPPDVTAALAPSIPAFGTPASDAYHEGDYDARWGRVPNPAKYADPTLQAAYDRGHAEFDSKEYLANFGRYSEREYVRESDESYYGTENYR